MECLAWVVRHKVVRHKVIKRKQCNPMHALALSGQTDAERRRAEAYMAKVIAGLEATAPGERTPCSIARHGRSVARSRPVPSNNLTSQPPSMQPQCALGLVSDDGDRRGWAGICRGRI